MEINANVLLQVSKERISQLEEELIMFKCICAQQSEQIEQYKKIIAESTAEESE